MGNTKLSDSSLKKLVRHAEEYFKSLGEAYSVEVNVYGHGSDFSSEEAMHKSITGQEIKHK